ncbi:MAG: DUF697 domain-containing protein [Anaerolineales bacterium]|nr:DUF697 domain-containing protein [Anaerolineales bacterium]
MTDWFKRFQRPSHPLPPEFYPLPESAEGPISPIGGSSFWENIRTPWQWDELAAEISQEGRARVAFMGLAGAGKSLLFNRIRGWVVSWTDSAGPVPNLFVESYGAFLLVDLPAQIEEIHSAANDDLLLTLGDPALFLYLLNAAQGVSQADYRWIARLRATGKPLIVVLNHCDRLADPAPAILEAQHRAGLPVIPISAATGWNVEDRLLPALLDAAPKLAITLGREIVGLRRHASRRVMRQVALFAALMSAQPIPLLDLPFQAMLQVGLVMRIGAAYGHPPTGAINREMVATVAAYLSCYALIQTLLKFIPILGWAVNALLGGLTSLIIGELAIRYYESDGRLSLPDLLTHWRQRFRRQPTPPPAEDEDIPIKKDEG